LEYAGEAGGKRIREAAIRFRYSFVKLMVAATITELQRLDIVVSEMVEEGGVNEPV
jgi:hypothetical protein